MSENLYEQLILLPTYLRAHLILTIAAMAASCFISVPLGIAAARMPRLKRPVMAGVSIIQTIPSLAILAIIVALLGGQIGFVPAFLALLLYSMLPIVRNTVTGLDSVAPEVIEAARGIGMTRGQILWKVQVPLAMPIIVAGIRTATVWTVGLATLSTLVGATSLGNYIFSGIQTRNLVAVTVGSVASGILALLLDGAIGAVQMTLEQRRNTEATTRRWTRFAIPVAAASVIAIAATFAFGGAKADFVVGGKGFTEQYIYAGLLADVLEDAGFDVDVRVGMGSDVVFSATRDNSVDAYLEYSGTVWANQLNREDNPGKKAVREAALSYMEEEGLAPVGPAGFENLYALAMRREHAESLGIETIEDLLPHAQDMICGGDLEFFSRPEWIRLRETYDIDFREKLTFDAALMYQALADGQVDLITAYTTDGRIAAYDFVVLGDPRDALLPYDGLIVASTDALSDPAFAAAITPLVDAIPSEVMRQANKIVDVDGEPVSAAVAYLRDYLDDSAE